jgi:hypothetical protein
MKLLITVLLSFCFSLGWSQSEQARLEKALFNLPNVSFKKTDTKDQGLKYELMIRQPRDHGNPAAGWFEQRVILTHRGFNKPTVIITQGYDMRTAPSEIELLLDANSLNVEYRFYGSSAPDSIPWQLLTIKNATADLHAINQLFRNIYPSKWISTGISKGGSTTIYYKYFYPDDVDLALPYVAPLDNSLEDKRIYAFLDTIGAKDCRDRIYQFQLFLLQNRTTALEKLKWFSKGAGITYTYTGSLEKAFEYSILEYPFSFFQYYNGCANVPTTKSVDAYLEELLKVSDISFFGDKSMKQYEAHYYQAATENGYYGYNIAPFKKYLKTFSSNPSAIFPPKNAVLNKYDPTLNEKVAKWLDEKGNNMIYFYGSMDTWTAAGVRPSSKVNAKRFDIPGGNHTTARIRTMDAAMRQEFANAVKQFTGLTVNYDVWKSF